MKKEICITILLLPLLFSCIREKNKLYTSNLSKKIDTISYSYKGFNNGLRLDLLSDGRFINEDYLFSCMGGGKRKKVFGVYRKDSLKLILVPKTIELKEYKDNLLMNAITTNLNYGVDSLKIKTEFQMVKWGGNEYLLSAVFDYGWSSEEENDYIRFADYFNSALEPETSGRYLVKRTKDSIKSDFDLQQIPVKWQGLFLKEPMVVKVKGIKKIIDPDDQEVIFWRIELDKGKTDGVNTDLRFYTKDKEFFIIIDSVLENRSLGRSLPYSSLPKKFRINSELRTKWN
ncbi:hypothetical protein ACQY1Q_10550 [Tenacibaculum sp. TC6]|uniref:hypothetical protein n=1 Tax=Tenacibaculum sp. TC6 TaxID=3423223 RepID=UPI003D362696